MIDDSSGGRRFVIGYRHGKETHDAAGRKNRPAFVPKRRREDSAVEGLVLSERMRNLMAEGDRVGLTGDAGREHIRAMFAKSK
jgi:hypothetical protein